MSARALAVIGSSPEAWGWTPVDATLEYWPSQGRPPIMKLPMSCVLENADVLKDYGFAWVVLDDSSQSKWHELVGVLQERQLPTMLSRPGETDPVGAMYKHGVVIGPAEASPEVLCTVLRTLWSQAGVISNQQREIRLLRAHQGGLCGQINKIDEELRTAAQLQREFMPTTLPRDRNVEFHVLFRPAGYVSGDIYDVARLDDRHMAFFLADAVGHGVPAALLTMHIKHSLRSKQIDSNGSAGHRIASPSRVLSLLNKDLMGQPGGKMRFASACYGVMDCQTLELDFARAGHPFPMLSRADGTTEFLDPEGTLLGIFPDKQFESIRVPLEPGDRLFLYSDGIELAFGYEHEKTTAELQNAPPYTEELKVLTQGPLEQAMQKFENKLDRQVGSLNLRDDLTVICLGVREDAVPSSVRQDEALATV